MSSFPASLRSLMHPAGGAGSGQRLLAGQARLLFGHSPVGIGAALLVARLQTVVLWDTADRNQLILWISSVVLATLLRLGLVIAYRYVQPDESQVSAWVLRIYIGNLLSGLIWGSSILLFEFSWPSQHQLFLMLVLTSVTAGAISAYAVVYPAIWWFMQQPESAHQLLGVILLIYMMSLTVIGHTHYRAARRSLELGLENQQLVGELTDTNRQFGREVEEKQHAMEALRNEKERAQVTLHSIGDGVITTDQNDNILYLNAVAEQLTGWSLREATGCPVQTAFRLVECVDREQPVTERRARVGESIRVYVKEHRFIWDGKVFEIGASIGLVEISETSDSVASILSAADIACYAAKDMGRNQVHIYHGSDSESGRRHSEIQLVSEITHAVQAEKLVLYFQDILPLGSSREYAPHGEVLVRMLGKQGELVPPALFLPAAECYDLMPSIDLWVIRNTFAWWSARCADRGVQSPGLISINLSGKSLGSESFQDRVLSLISEYQIVPGTICFEITETAAISSFELATRFIDRLRSCGMKIALDDFGSGLNSFAYLKNLSVDYLKIDGSFVRDIVDDAIDREMVKSIQQLARVMGIQTIAECVENDQIFAQLKDIL